MFVQTHVRENTCLCSCERTVSSLRLVLSFVLCLSNSSTFLQSRANINKVFHGFVEVVTFWFMPYDYFHCFVLYSSLSFFVFVVVFFCIRRCLVLYLSLSFFVFAVVLFCICRCHFLYSPLSFFVFAVVFFCIFRCLLLYFSLFSFVFFVVFFCIFRCFVLNS